MAQNGFNYCFVIFCLSNLCTKYLERLLLLHIENGHGDMYHQKTLEDWAGFNINNRTKYDASISSGLAIMACNKNRYIPVAIRQKKSINLGIKRYDNTGYNSKIK